MILNAIKDNLQLISLAFKRLSVQAYVSLHLPIYYHYVHCTLLVESTQAHDVYSCRLRVKFMLHRCIYVLLGPLHPPPPMVMVPPVPLWSGWWKSDDGVAERDSMLRLCWKWRSMDM